jgi:uncharacterized protein
MKRVLLVSAGLVHPPYPARQRLRACLAHLPGVRLETAASLERLPAGLDDCAALVLYLHHRHISAAALSRLEGFVAGGGGLLGVHSALASFKQQPVFASLLGGRFAGHGPVQLYEISPVENRSAGEGGAHTPGGVPATGGAPITGGPFAGTGPFTLTDELYLAELLDGSQVHFTTQSVAGPVPVVWTRSHGRGRVCCASPGHTIAAMASPDYQQVLLRGLEWVCRA